MLKYNDKVLIVKDEENDGFYIGLEGIVKEVKIEKQIIGAKGEVEYGLEIKGEERRFWVKEDQLQKI